MYPPLFSTVLLVEVPHESELSEQTQFILRSPDPVAVQLKVAFSLSFTVTVTSAGGSMILGQSASKTQWWQTRSLRGNVNFRRIQSYSTPKEHNNDH